MSNRTRSMKRRNQKMIRGPTSLKTKKKSSRNRRQKHMKRLQKGGELGHGLQASRSSVSSSPLNRGIKELRLRTGREVVYPLVSVGVTHGARGTHARRLGPQVWTHVRRRPIVKIVDKLEIGREIRNVPR